MKTVVVATHEAFVDFVFESIGLPDNYIWLRPPVQPSDIAGSHVIGALPPYLAIYPAIWTHFPLRLPRSPEDREEVMSDSAAIAACALPPISYRVETVETPTYLEI